MEADLESFRFAEPAVRLGLFDAVGEAVDDLDQSLPLARVDPQHRAADADSFLAHFEKRKVSIGTCARAFSSPCVHEHACVRCSLLRPDPAQRGRLEEIRDNLLARIAEAEREGWLGEVEGLQVSLAGAQQKLAQVDQFAARTTVNLGMPTYNRRSWIRPS
ncbi:hypothetical protein ACF07Y_39480 [Streptomyces sp. NPDC016566]|uniref:hypothetical protein n=1 Tax=Streptomyces sp. NPDC016566 TaxID=3364967 RepID=UPI0036FA8900